MAVSSVADGKAELRRRILSARRQLDPAALAAAADAVTATLRPWLAGLTTVAAYVPSGSEPGSRALLEELREQCVRVLLPIPGPDWVRYDGTLLPGRFPQPAGVPSGAAAVREAQLVVVPALAVDAAGNRLGRGGGFYDRALVAVRSPVVALLHDGEVLDRVPTEAHDHPVDAVITPSLGWRRVDALAPGGAP